MSEAPSAESAESVAVAALEWLAGVAREDGAAVAWPTSPGDARTEPSFYSGSAGVVVTLLEAHAHLGDDRWADLAVRGARGLADAVADQEHRSLYFGTAGIAVVLHEVGTHLGDPVARAGARRGLDVLRSTFDGRRWGSMFELMGGNAGIALAALRLGDVELAETAVEPYLAEAEHTAYGVTWENRDGLAARRHHISHGTLGVVCGLAATADATGRTDLLDLALRGAEDVVARNEAGEEGFLVPHSDPQQVHPWLERYSYGWCHGPAGDAQVFRLLHRATGEDRWLDLQDRCWSTVLGSGLPQRLRPGFWDNNGRCCGTAGVLALASDRRVERAEDPGPAGRLVTDLLDRVVVDEDGARWSNHEHRAADPDLEPRTDWAMGAAGIARELLRHARLDEGRDPSYAVAWPDQLPTR